ncbi:amidohydrolase [Ectobacillus ponti]|uniref:Amidohydrolase n=1 Tax=Ectobacillus ponti TaxID=2961894 RepID=A0AA42BSL5_9BACI|nr:amidohydrolase [Ectobacillus ponti]MCP8968563.1 amidohydrolase [Ectobacillus ponti]
MNHSYELNQEQLRGWRRHLHQNPELSFQEERTSQFVYDTLCTFEGLTVTRPTSCSVMAILRSGRPGKTIALRADMDALPLQEETGAEYASRVPGVMHACGHDGHTAILLETARILAGMRQQISGEIRFFFQHAEEQYPGGAEEMVRAGVMDGVDAVFGLHLMSGLETGKIGIAYGPMMAAPDVFQIEVQGKGGHAARPEETIDPIAVGMQIVNNLQHIVSRATGAFDQRVVSVTQFHAGTADNIIPDTASIMGTVRCFRQELREEADELIGRIANGIAAAHGASCTYQYRYGYRPVVNDHRMTALVEKVAGSLAGRAAVVTVPPSMGGEDFSAFLQKAPGCFFKLGSGNAGKGTNYPHHHPRFDIDEEALPLGVEMFVHLICRLSAE